jgi:hypothetical protein
MSRYYSLSATNKHLENAKRAYGYYPNHGLINKADKLFLIQEFEKAGLRIDTTVPIYWRGFLSVFHRKVGVSLVVMFQDGTYKYVYLIAGALFINCPHGDTWR